METCKEQETPTWNRRRNEKRRRIEKLGALANDKIIPADRIIDALQTLIASGDRVVLEGNNQKQADFLARSLVKTDPSRLHDLHMIMPSVGLPEYLDLFERGIARKLDFSFSGPQSLRISQLLEDGALEIGAIHTYIELYSRLFVDLTPNVALVAGYSADRKGNLYTGPSTEDTPAIVEATAFRNGIVIAQVNELVLTGVILSARKLKINGMVIFSAIFKNIVQPFIAWGIALVLGLDPLVTLASVLLISLSAGFFGVVFGNRYGVQSPDAEGALLVSTAGFIVTAPLFIVLTSHLLHGA